jgi:5-(carboxyamino)imidazole ribonucleotide synthase
MNNKAKDFSGTTLGVMGGGQLGRMFVHAAQRLGFQTAVLDADNDSPAGLVAHHHIQSGYLDERGLAQMTQLCAAITTEFENVPAAALRELANTKPVHPEVGRALRAACGDTHAGRFGEGVARFAARHSENQSTGL